MISFWFLQSASKEVNYTFCWAGFEKTQKKPKSQLNKFDDTI